MDVAYHNAVGQRRVLLAHVWRAAVPLLVFAAAGSVAIKPNDFWWHLRAGQYIWAHRSVPAVDLFSFTQTGQPWTYQAWLAEVLWYTIYSWGGAPGVLLVHAALISLSYWLVCWGLERKYSVRVAALSALAAAAMGVANWGVRPQTFSFPLFALTLVSLEQSRGRPQPPWWLLPVVVLWANLHGAVIFGLAAVFLYALPPLLRGLREPSRRLGALRWLLFAAAAGLATGITPYGPLGMARYYMGFLRSPVTLQANVEFMPLTLRDWDGSLFFGAVLVYFSLLLKNGRRPAAEHALGLLVFGLGTLWSHRTISWFGFVYAAALAEQLANLPFFRRALSPGKPALNAALLVALLIFAASRLPWLRGLWPPLTPKYLLVPNTPVDAVAYLCQTAQNGARVYQEQAFGSYQIWACPRLPVFIDTRIELYPLDQWRDYFAIAEGRFDWEAIARRYRLTHLLLDRNEQRHAVRAAEASPCWEKVYEDKIAVIFAYTCPESRDERGRQALVAAGARFSG